MKTNKSNMNKGNAEAQAKPRQADVGQGEPRQSQDEPRNLKLELI